MSDSTCLSGRTSGQPRMIFFEASNRHIRRRPRLSQIHIYTRLTQEVHTISIPQRRLLQTSHLHFGQSLRPCRDDIVPRDGRLFRSLILRCWQVDNPLPLPTGKDEPASGDTSLGKLFRSGTRLSCCFRVLYVSASRSTFLLHRVISEASFVLEMQPCSNRLPPPNRGMQIPVYNDPSAWWNGRRPRARKRPYVNAYSAV